MVDKTTTSETMDRTALAEYLHDLAGEFEEVNDIDVPVGNKRVTLSPPSDIDCTIEVNERSPVVGEKEEIVEIAVSWTPTE